MASTATKRRISTSEACGILKQLGFTISIQTVIRWCKNGTLKKAKKFGGQWYIDEEELRGMTR